MRHRSHGHVPAALGEAVTSDPAVLHGVPVFAGTRVAVETLLDYRRGGVPLYEFLVDFPAVRRSQAKRVWAWLEKRSVAEARKALGLAEASHAAGPASEHKRGAKQHGD